MLGDVLKQIIREFPLTDEERAKKPFKGDKTANFMRRGATNELKNIIKSSYNLDDYVISVSPGQSQWNHRPWGGIINKEVATTFQKGFYVVYLFSTDRKGVYLSLNQGYTSIERNAEIKDKIGELENRSSFLRNSISEIPEDFLNHEIDCKDEKREKTQAGNIISKYYSIDDLDNEEMLLNDLDKLMKIYNELIPVYKQKFIEKPIEKNPQNDNEINVWRIYPGDSSERETLWPKFKEKGYIGIGWFVNNEERDYNEFNSIKELKDALKKTYQVYYEGRNPSTSASAILDFRDSMKIGDYIVASGGYNKILGVGIIKSDYIGPNDPNNPLLDKDYTHVRKVDWKIVDELELADYIKNKKRFFQQQTFSKLKWEKWLEIEIEYSKKYDTNLIKKMYIDFNKDYLSQQAGIEHYNSYGRVENLIKNYIEKIEKNPKILNNVDDPFLHKFLPINRDFISPTGFRTFKAFGYSPDDYPKLSLAIYSLINDLFNANDKNTQKEIIKKFIASPYSSGSQSGVISPALHALRTDYLIINSKTVNSINLLSRILRIPIKIDTKLANYMDNNEKLEGFLKELALVVPQLSDFHRFDAFCHWLCDKKLANYADGNILPLKYILAETSDPEHTITSFTEFLSKEGFYFEPKTIENFLLSLKVKPFVILTGNSGTGKTKIAQLFCEYLALKNGECHKIVPVGANWTENRHILGFYNVITNEYMKSDALELILEARKEENKNKPFFLILDEMNLSHVERYFADFLSSMESGEKIYLHKSDVEKKVPKSLEIPKNLFVIGTVNVDETTYMFSPKVLDRANVIEFSTSPAKNYMLNGINQEELKGNVKYIENPLSNIKLRNKRISDIKEHIGNVYTEDNEKLWDVLSEELNKFQEALKKAGFDFGFRVIDEILRFMYVALVYYGENEDWDWQRYFDAQIKQKMLPKIHGSQRTLEMVLIELFEHCCFEKSEKSPRNFGDILSKGDVRYHSSALKLQEMDKVLYEQRYVAFIN